ncbi:MAG: lactate utilization protein [Clostridiales bacterium]|nr:lactate utilization protein [Clostridiales bacterium]
MDAVQKWRNKLKIEELMKVLKERGFDPIYAETPEEAKKITMDMIPEGAKIAVGGSVTLNETGILDEIRSDKYNFIDRYSAKSFEDMLDKYREGYYADVFVSSTNAVTMGGQLVNIDCTGNRTSQIVFGPKKVIIVAGVNKIVENVEDGIKRAKSIAPMNARRIGHKTPCAQDDSCACTECTCQARMCNVTSIVDGCHYFPGRISIVLVPEPLGY